MCLLLVQAVSQGLGPQDALSCVVQAVQAAGGSFKALQKQLHKQALQTYKQLASAGGADTSAAAAVAGAGHAEGDVQFPLIYSDLKLAAGKGGKAAAVSRLSGSAAAADKAGGMTAGLNPVLQSLSLAEGLADGCKDLGTREVMSHPVAWADCADLDD